MLLLAIPTQGTSLQVFSNLLEIALIFLLLKDALKYPHQVGKQNRNLAILLMFVFVIFSFWGTDWFHYYEGYVDMLKGERGHMEPVYEWIARHLSFNYISFRFVIWGVSLMLVIDLFKRLPVNNNLTLLFFGTIWIIWFSYARVSAAITLSLWGLSLLFVPYKKIPHLGSYLIGLAAMVASLAFHKTAFFIILVIVVSYLTIKIKTEWLVAMLGVAVFLFFNYIYSYIDLLFTFEGDFAESGASQAIAYGQFYLSADEVHQGIGLRISFLIEELSFFLVGLQCFLFLVKKDTQQPSFSIQMFIRITLFIVLISALLNFVGGFNTATLFRRFLRYAQIPSAIVFSYFWERKRYDRLNRITLIVGIMSTIYAIGYQWYLAP